MKQLLLKLQTVQLIVKCVKRVFASSKAKASNSETLPTPVAQALLSTLRLLRVKPNPAGDEWKVTHPYAKEPLSVHPSEDLAMQAAEYLLRHTEGGSIVLQGANGDVIREEPVQPAGLEGTSKEPTGLSIMTLDLPTETPVFKPARIIEVRRDPLHGEWEIVLAGQQDLLVRETRESAIEDAEELLREEGGGEILVLRGDGSGEIAERVWLLEEHRGISSNAPRICRRNWPQRQKEGWKHFATIPSLGFDASERSIRSGWALIDLLQALVGVDNVKSAFAFRSDVPGESSDRLNICVRCSDEDLTRLRTSFSWFRLAALLDLDEDRSCGRHCPCALVDGGPRSVPQVPRTCRLVVGRVGHGVTVSLADLIG